MAEAASKINAPALAPAQSATPARTYPLGPLETPSASTRPFTAILALVVLSLLGGVLMLLARGGMQRWQSVTGSSEGLITVVFLAQAAAAVLCFVFLIRWMRS